MLIVTYIIYCNIPTGVHIPLVHSENWQVCHFVPSAYKIVKTMYTSMNISALSNVLAMRVRPTLYYKTKVICVANLLTRIPFSHQRSCNAKASLTLLAPDSSKTERWAKFVQDC